MQGTILILASVVALGQGCGKKDKKEAVAEESLSTVEEQETRQLTIDASSKDSAVWRYFDFETGTSFGADEKQNDDDWDLAFQRFKIKSNGGISGAAGVSVARLTDAFDDVKAAPADGYREDQDDGDDADTDPDYVFLQEGGWYDYDPVEHTLSPKALVFVAQTPAGHYYKITITKYYDEAGTPGMIGVKWAEINVPAMLAPEGRR